MSDASLMWMEIIFDLAYLLVAWTLVITMARRNGRLPQDTRPLRNLFILAFFLLTLGDTGHVGFRVIAYALGNLDAAVMLFGKPFSLVGLGALSTSITLTFFYVVVLWMWKTRYNKPLGWFGWLLIATAAARLVILALPQNQWATGSATYGWELLRNLPLTIQGLGVMVLFFRDSAKTNDRVFRAIAFCILLSYAFYAPVILFVAQVPMLGMLMMPKTLAYVAIAVIGFRSFFQLPARKSAAVQTA